LWDAQESAYKKIDHIHEQLSNTNALSSQVLEALIGVQTKQDTTLATVSEAVAALGKLQTEQEAQGARLGTVEETQQELKHGQASLAGQMSNLSEEVNTHAERLGAVEERVASLEARVGSMEGEVARVVQAVDGNQRLLERWSRTQPAPHELRDDAA
jgi:chromosome segregation ATPase